MMLIIATSSVFGQEYPTFPGDEKALTEYIQDNLQYPQEALDSCQEDIVYIKFVINTNGTISNIEFTIKSPYEALNKEALRVVKNMPNWNPGNNSQNFQIPFKFKLSESQLKKCIKKAKKEQKAKLDETPTASEKKHQKSDAKKHRKAKKEHQKKIKQ